MKFVDETLKKRGCLEGNNKKYRKAKLENLKKKKNKWREILKWKTKKTEEDFKREKKLEMEAYFKIYKTKKPLKLTD